MSDPEFLAELEESRTPSGIAMYVTKTLRILERAREMEREEALQKEQALHATAKPSEPEPFA